MNQRNPFAHLVESNFKIHPGRCTHLLNLLHFLCLGFEKEQTLCSATLGGEFFQRLSLLSYISHINRISSSGISAPYVGLSIIPFY